MLLNSLRLSVKCLQTANPLRGRNNKTVAQVQRYSGYSPRQPVRIVNEEEILEYVEAAEGPNEFIERDMRKPLEVRPKKPKAVKNVDVKKRMKVTEADTLKNEDGSLKFTELKENDHLLTSLMMSVRSRKTRDRNGRIVLEGKRLITDAIEAGSIPEIVVFSRTDDVMKLPLPEKGVRLYKTPYRAIQTWTTLTTSPGIMAFFKMPDVESIAPPPDALPLTIICDNVREPGNLGSILRACAAVGCKQLILVKGCVDLWDSKVLRSAAGAHFRMPIFATRTWREIRAMIDLSAHVWVADNNAILVQDEEDGALDDDKTAETRKIEEELVKESSETSKKSQRRLEKLNLDAVDELLESVADESEDKTYAERQRDAKLAKKIISTIPLIPYYATNYENTENVIIVGGETEGVSLEALALTHERSGVRINIPMTNGVESLNTGMALGIIAFEIRRQLSLRKKSTDVDETT